MTTGHHYASIIELHPALCKADISFRQIIEKRIENSEDQKTRANLRAQTLLNKFPSTKLSSLLFNFLLYKSLCKFHKFDNL